MGKSNSRVTPHNRFIIMRVKSHVSIFLVATILALLIGGFFLFQFPKADIHLFINDNHNPFADLFFKYVTYLGEGWLFLVAILFFIFLSWRDGLVVAFAGIFTGIVTGIFKNSIYAGAPRPIEFFSGLADLYIVPGVEMNHWNSFPSGHTMAAFALYFSLAILLEKKGLSILFFMAALFVGYSRMYLSQHFLVDVVAGAGLGIICASIGNLVASKLPWKKLDGRALDLFKK